MAIQNEFWAVSDQHKLMEAIMRLEKLERIETGLFKRLKELKTERECVVTIVEDINHNQIYGK